MNKIKDNRNWLIVWLLTIVTFGFYSFYLTYVQIRDTNTICANDGQRTAGLFKLLILGFLTFGIYFLIWDIKLVSRWQHYAEDASEKPKYWRKDAVRGGPIKGYRVVRSATSMP